MGLNTHLDIGAWNFLYVVNLFFVLYVFFIVYGKLHTQTRRFVLGLGLVFTGLSLRIAGWTPWRSFLYLEKDEWALWYRDYSWVWTSGGAFLFIIGVSIFIWPFIKQKFGAWTIPTIIISQCATYFVGYEFTKYFGDYLIKWWS